MSVLNWSDEHPCVISVRIIRVAGVGPFEDHIVEMMSKDLKRPVVEI